MREHTKRSIEKQKQAEADFGCGCVLHFFPNGFPETIARFPHSNPEIVPGSPRQDPPSTETTSYTERLSFENV